MSLKKDKIEKNYQIIRVERQLVTTGLFFKKSRVVKNKITMVKFYAEDDNAARIYLKDYKKVANKKYVYFFERYQPIRIMKNDGSVAQYDSYQQIADDEKLIRRIWDNIVFELQHWFISKPMSMVHWISDLIYMIKNKHMFGEHWSFDCHMIDDIIWNVPILLKQKHGIANMFLDRAIIELHKSTLDFDIRKWNEEHHYNCSKEETQLALKYQEEEFMKLLEYAKLYKYYSNFGIIDEKNISEVEFDQKWHHTLPIISGTYDSIDYKRLNELTTKYWNKIWMWIREFGQTLWD